MGACTAVCAVVTTGWASAGEIAAPVGTALVTVGAGAGAPDAELGAPMFIGRNGSTVGMPPRPPPVVAGPPTLGTVCPTEVGPAATVAAGSPVAAPATGGNSGALADRARGTVPVVVGCVVIGAWVAATVSPGAEMIGGGPSGEVVRGTTVVALAARGVTVSGLAEATTGGTTRAGAETAAAVAPVAGVPPRRAAPSAAVAASDRISPVKASRVAPARHPPSPPAMGGTTPRASPGCVVAESAVLA